MLSFKKIGKAVGEKIKKRLPRDFKRAYVRYVRCHKYSINYNKNQDKISEVYDMLADDYSKETMKAYMDYIVKLKSAGLIKVTRPFKKHYFDEQVIKLTENETFVDMGALDAPTSLQFAETVNYKYNKILLFEPDSESWERTASNVKKLPAHPEGNSVFVFNEGCYDYNGKVFFSDGASGGSHISEASLEKSVNVVTLDSKLETMPEVDDITFIKMDIEGAEHKALMGCSNTIKKFKPKLAVSIYHKAEDIYDLPLLIKKILPEYKLYIRHYDYRHIMSKFSESALQYELVCYAVL